MTNTIEIGGHRGFNASPSRFTRSSHLVLSDHRALAVIEKQREQNLKLIFDGTKLVFKPLEQLKQIRDVSKKVNKSVGAVKTAATGSGKATPGAQEKITTAINGAKDLPGAVGQDAGASRDFVLSMLNVGSIRELGTLLPEFAVTEVIADVMPVVSQLRSGYKTIKALADTGKSIHTNYRMGHRIKDLLPGDPEGAGRALRTMVRREIGEHASKAAIQGTKFALSTASLTADGGTAANVAMSLISLSQKLVLLGIELTDMRAGNRRLAVPETLDLTVFDDCPILGCYLIVCSNTSDLVNLITTEIGRPGWQGDVERMVKDSIAPMSEDARRVIKRSHLELQGLKAIKMARKPGFLEKLVGKKG